jgi:predicted PurR-regulated permease PerM
MGYRKKYLLLFLSLAFIVLAAWFLEKIVIYLLVAAFLSLLASPVNGWLIRQKIGKYPIPAGLSAFLSLLFLYAVVMGVIGLFIPLLLDEAGILMRTNPTAVIASLHEPISKVDLFMNTYCPGQFSSEQFLQAKIPSMLNAALLGSFANSFVGFTGGLFIAFFAVSFFTFFFLKDGALIFETLMMLSPPTREEDIRQILHNCKRLLSKYFSGL